MATHTPGPWTLDLPRSAKSRRIAISGAGVDLAETTNALPRDVGEANARLIAVAPRLLMHARGAWHLCQSILATRDGATDDLIRELADALQADIAEAEGR